MPIILIVDDDPEIRSTLKKLLELSGHGVLTAKSGLAAIESLEQAQVDLMITDIVMPDQDGLASIKLARQANPDLPIIAMSGGSQLHTEDYLRLAKAFGANDVLQKPFDASALLEAIKRTIGDLRS